MIGLATSYSLRRASVCSVVIVRVAMSSRTALTIKTIMLFASDVKYTCSSVGASTSHRAPGGASDGARSRNFAVGMSLANAAQMMRLTDEELPLPNVIHEALSVLR